MRAVLQRVNYASAKVDNKIIGSCQRGWLILLGVKKGDTEKDAEILSKKIPKIKAFSNKDEKMTLNLFDISGEALIVSQFTLYGNTKKGNRPNFTEAAPADLAVKLYEFFISCMKKENIAVETGMFGEKMKIEPICDGPVTLVLDS